MIPLRSAILPAFMLVTVLFNSCKKEKDKEETCTASTATISGSYKITAVTYKLNSTAPEENHLTDDFTDACDRDNVYTYQTNGTYQIQDAGTVCSPSSDDNGTWSLSGNSMVVDGGPSTIESFDCKTLVLSLTDVEVTGDKYKITFTKQ